MKLDAYKEVFNNYFDSKEYLNTHQLAKDLLAKRSRIFFIGNGGSNSISSHMMEDYAKIAGYQTFAFSDAALITCFANDYGYEKAIEEWLKIYLEPNDVLVAISSSGNSMNIVNAVNFARSKEASVITLSGFSPDNKISSAGDVNFHIGASDFGIVECFHKVILHVLLDELADIRKK